MAKSIAVAMVFYTPFNLPADWAENSVLICQDPSLTVQADRDQADINTIVRQFGLTGQLPYGVDVPEYGDFSDIPNDYHQAIQFTEALSASFMELPAPIRTRFDNDPGLFLDFFNDPSNQDEAIKLGFAIDNRPVVAEGETADSPKEPTAPAVVAQSPT